MRNEGVLAFFVKEYNVKAKSIVWPVLYFPRPGRLQIDFTPSSLNLSILEVREKAILRGSSDTKGNLTDL